jgi:hypothetical protein
VRLAVLTHEQRPLLLLGVEDGRVEEEVVVDPEAGIYGVLNPETGEYEDPSAVTEIRTDESEWMEYVWFKFGINGSVFARSLLRLKERGIVASEAGLVWTLDRDAHHRAWLEQFGGGLVDEPRKRTPGERGRSRPGGGPLASGSSSRAS